MIREIRREITKEQYEKATKEHVVDGIFSAQEVCGYGVYCEQYYQADGKYWVKFQLGSSCD